MKKLKNKFLFRLLGVFLLSFLCFQQVYAVDYPKPTEYKYVNDYANIIKKEELETIVSIGKELEDKTGAQAVIVTIKSLEDNDLDDYANKLFRKWGIGQEGKNNGLLILIAKDDRKWKVEVGTGLEGAVTDIQSRRIVDEYFTPEAKKGNYGKGLKYSYSALADKIAKEYNVSLDKNKKITLPGKKSSSSSSKSGNKFISIIVILIILDIFANKGRVLGKLIEFMFWDAIFNGRGRRKFYDDDDDDHFGGFGGFGGGGSGGSSGGFGGFGGGSSSGGGSSGSW
ncbi:TPM domain-containing protein [Haloimpatiens lingqiaonensis]|uniref:TPM domain-containing protein n=1 Tax=Haloimpatiens lingqiaonensis TaxID=1380675 RepID=UPI0010FE79C1|nr:TPM domain-containing protein [Haloimpatiens lingqiaonensis]